MKRTDPEINPTPQDSTRDDGSTGDRAGMESAPWMDRHTFERLVRDAIEALPEQFHHALENVAIVVEDEPDPDELRAMGLDPEDDELFGVYNGVPLTDRDGPFPGLPDRIVIFRGPILRSCDTPEEIALEVRDTVVHELGHHMGLDDDEMPY